MTKRILSWEAIDEASLSIAQQAAHRNINVIIALARGGLIPSRLIANHLGVSKIVSIGISTYDKDHQQSGEIDVYQSYGKEFKDKKLISESNVLVVDDLVDSGNTFGYVLLGLCEEVAPRSIQSAVLYVKPKSKYVPDFYHKKLTTNPWLVFPWETKPIKLNV